MSLKIESGLATQIRDLERRLKEFDTKKANPTKVKEITDLIKDLKQMLKEKLEKKEQRKKDKEQKAQEVEKEAISVPNAADVGAVAQNPPAPAAASGAPAATPDDQKVSCPLCGGMTFNDNASYQQHMAYTHASDIMPTNPGQKQDNLVAAVEAPVAAPETAPKETVPQFKLDDVVKPTRGSESTGKVMRWDGKPSDLVYVSWESGPLADRDGFGGYYPHDLELFKEEPVEAAIPMEKPVCADCVSMKEKHGDLKTNYESLLKDLKEERDIHYTQGNSSWVARLDQKIQDLQNSIKEKFGIEPEACSACGQKKQSGIGFQPTSPELRKAITLLHSLDEDQLTNKAYIVGVLSAKGMHEAAELINEMSQDELEDFIVNNLEKEAGAQNDKENLTVLDHTPSRANSGPDAGGLDPADDFQDEWAMPVTSGTKLNVFKRELLATPLNEGYDISQGGKKLFHIKGKDSKPMTKEQIEFCAQIELTRGLKQARLTSDVAFLKKGTKVYILAQDKEGKRLKFASLEQGLRGWCSSSKIKLEALESQAVSHNGHSDKVLGQTATETLLDCIEGGPIWVNSTELLDANRPPATPESLNEDLGKDSAAKCPKCRGEGRPGMGSCPECGAYSTDIKERKQSAKECPDCHGTFEGAEGQTCPTCGRFAVQKEALRPALPPQILNRRQEVNAENNSPLCSVEGCENKADSVSDGKRYCYTHSWGKDPKKLKEASLDKVSYIVKRKDGWHVLSEKGKNLGGPYSSREKAKLRLKQVEYFKHQGVFRPFSKQVYAEVLTDPYQTLSTHITEMRTRMDQVNERLQNAPAVKTAKEDAAPEMDLAALFADLIQGIDLLETKLGGDDIEPELHKGVEELENKLWTLEEKLGLTPKLSEHEKAEPEHKEVVEKAKEMDKEAAVVTDETIEETTNDPSLANPSLTPIPPPTPGFQNIQPTDNDNLEISVPMPTSPPPPGQKWQFNSVDKVYVLMPDTTNPAKLV